MAALAEEPRNEVSCLCNSCYTRVSPALLSCPSPASFHSPGSFFSPENTRKRGLGLETRSTTADLEQCSFASCIVLTRNPAHTRGIQTLSGTERNGVPLFPSRNTAAKIPRGNFPQAQPFPSFQKDFHKPQYLVRNVITPKGLSLSQDGMVQLGWQLHVLSESEFSGNSSAANLHFTLTTVHVSDLKHLFQQLDIFSAG